MDGDTYSIVTSRDDRDRGVQLIRVHEDGSLEAVASDTLPVQSNPAFQGVTAFTLRDGHTYAAVSAPSFDSVALFKISLPEPSVQYVTSPDADGYYADGDKINVTVVFDARVYLAGGPPALRMNTGHDATFVSGNGTTALAFEYDVRADDGPVALDHDGRTALAGATITNYLGDPVDRLLPAAGSGNTLGELDAIWIDMADPELLSVSSLYDDLYGPHTITDPGAVVPIALNFDGPVSIYEGAGGRDSYNRAGRGRRDIRQRDVRVRQRHVDARLRVYGPAGRPHGRPELHRQGCAVAQRRLHSGAVGAGPGPAAAGPRAPELAERIRVDHDRHVPLAAAVDTDAGDRAARVHP